jgi:RNA polymerase sigma-70 factor (ECF subfamily)
LNRNYDSQNDEALVEAVNRGEAGAFDALYFRHRDWVHRLAWRFTGDEELALDVLQETFAYLLGKLPGLRLTAKMTTFLYPAVKNLSITARRKRDRLPQNEEALMALPSPHDASPDVADLALALAVLSGAQRETLLMRFVDGMELHEIAEVLGVPLGTVKSRIHIALNILGEDGRAKRYFLDH